MGLTLRGAMRGGFKVEIRHLFPERLARPPTAGLQLHYLYRSHRLAAFYCLPLLSTFTVYSSVCASTVCVWGYSISLRQRSITGNRVAVHSFNTTYPRYFRAVCGSFTLETAEYAGNRPALDIRHRAGVDGLSSSQLPVLGLWR